MIHFLSILVPGNNSLIFLTKIRLYKKNIIPPIEQIKLKYEIQSKLIILIPLITYNILLIILYFFILKMYNL